MWTVTVTNGESITFLLHAWGSWSDVQDAVYAEGCAKSTWKINTLMWDTFRHTNNNGSREIEAEGRGLSLMYDIKNLQW